jgi:putative transcriptional regulator
MNDTDFEQLLGGVKEVIAHLDGKQTLRKTVITVPDEPPAYTAEEVRQLRESLQLSQGLFAKILNVSVNTVRKWEQDERHPSGPSARLLQIAQVHPEYLLNDLKARSVA